MKVYKNYEEYAEDKHIIFLSDDGFISQQAWEACATSKDHEYCNRFYSIGGALAKLKKLIEVGVFTEEDYAAIMKLIAIIERSQDENINP